MEKQDRRAILIIEDNLVNLKLIKDILMFHNYDIIEAHDGKEALDKIYIHHEQIGLILMDLLLPEIGGIELIKMFKNTPKLKCIPIIVLSALAMDNSLQRASEAGCDAYITKPINIEDFINKVETFFLKDP